jgi:hypothetical protein
MTIADLGFAIESSTAVAATSALEKMTAASAHAEAAATRLGSATRSEAAGTAAATAAARVHTMALHAEAAASRMVANDTRMLGFQINDIVVSLASGMNPAMVALQQGSQISQIGLRGLTAVIAPMAPILLAVGAAAAGVAVIFGGLTVKINETSKVNVSMWNVFVATIEVAAAAIGRLFKPAIDQVGSWFKQLVDWIAPAFKGAFNFVVGFFAQGFQHAVVSWQLLPAALSDIAVMAFNGVLGALEDMLNNSRNQIVKFLADAGAAAGPLFGAALIAGSQGLAGAGKVSLGRLDNPNAGTASFIAGQTDYGGNTLGAISTQAQALALADIASKADKAKDKVKSLTQMGFGQATVAVNEFANAAKSAFSNLGTGIIDAFKKGGNVALNVLDMLLGKVGNLGESLLNTGLNKLLGIGVSALFGGGIGGGLGIAGGVLHNGGIAGLDGYGTGRTFHPSAWAGAPRYHNGGIAGLLPGEVPAILQKGERVIPANQNMQSAANGNGPTININITGSKEDAAAIARQVAKAIPDAIAAYNLNSYRR